MSSGQETYDGPDFDLVERHLTKSRTGLLIFKLV